MGFPNGHGADFGSGCNRKELANLVKGYLAYGLGTISVNDHIASSVHAQELALVLRFTGGDDHLTAQDAIQAAEWYVAWGKALPHLERVRDILGNHLVAAHDLDLRL
ncbi:MAG: hypothetical protein Q7S65_04525 [Nanoarchaeota archaeon]|nr:hypothetical protein [Nanoarchaeota archaeon]